MVKLFQGHLHKNNIVKNYRVEHIIIIVIINRETQSG